MTACRPFMDVVVGAGISVVDNAFVGMAVSVGMTLASGAQEAKIRETSKMVSIFLILIDILLYKEPPNGVRPRSAPEGVLPESGTRWRTGQDNAALTKPA